MSPAELLRTLQSSELFSPDFPRRSRYTQAEWDALSEDARGAAHVSGREAIALATSWRDLEDIVRELARARYEPAVPTLAALWTDCALVPVRNAAGHALREIGSSAARAALESLLEDLDDLSVFLAIRAIFDADRTAAFDRFAPYFQLERLRQHGGAVIPYQVLATFAPWSFTRRNGVEIPDWRDDAWAPALFVSDRRWLELAIELRHHPDLGAVARRALRYADREIVTSALDGALRSEPSRIARPRTVAVGDLVTRYLRGEHDEVWRELRKYPAIGGELREEALAVARETMRRVARAADVVAERLADRGWRALGGALRTPPEADDRAIFERIATITGAPLPTSLQAFWEEVGSIDFVWDYNEEEEDGAPDLGVALDMAQMDPLAVYPPDIAEDLFDEWEYQRRHHHPELIDPYNLDLAPDYLHKANISGGPPYGVELPFRGADPIFVNEAHGLPFVDYLRLCFRWGGFPGLERHADRSDVRAFVARMREGVEPF